MRLVKLFVNITILSTLAKANVYHMDNVTSAFGGINTLSTLDDGLVYFTGRENFYSYSPETGERNTISIMYNTSQWSASTTLNDKIYITNDRGSVYEYNQAEGVLEVAKTNELAAEGVAALNEKVYFGTSSGKLYEFDPESRKTIVVSNTQESRAIFGVAALNCKVYYVTFGNAGRLHEFDPVTGTTTQISLTIYSRKIIEFDDKLYFDANHNSLREYDPKTKIVRTLCVFPEDINPIALTVFSGNIYIGGVSSRTLWKLNLSETPSCEAIPKDVNEKGNIQALVALKDKLYIGSSDSFLYEFYETTDKKHSNCIETLNYYLFI